MYVVMADTPIAIHSLNQSLVCRETLADVTLPLANHVAMISLLPYQRQLCKKLLSASNRSESFLGERESTPQPGLR